MLMDERVEERSLEVQPSRGVLAPAAVLGAACGWMWVLILLPLVPLFVKPLHRGSSYSSGLL